MKLFKVAVCAAALLGTIGLASAQPPKEIEAVDTITLSTGQTRTFTFDQAITEIKVVDDGIVKVKPLTDHEFSVTALSPGAVLTIAYNGNSEVHRMNFAVEGHTVKVYGYTGVKDYVGFTCTSTSCGRADPDLGPTPSKVTVTNTSADKDGNSHSVAKEYR